MQWRNWGTCRDGRGKHPESPDWTNRRVFCPVFRVMVDVPSGLRAAVKRCDSQVGGWRREMSLLSWNATARGGTPKRGGRAPRSGKRGAPRGASRGGKGRLEAGRPGAEETDVPERRRGRPGAEERERPGSLNGASPRSEGGCVRTKSLRPEALGHARRLPWASAASSRSCRRQAQRAEPCALPCGYAPSKRSLVSAMMAPRSRASSSRAAASASSVACRRDRQACASHANPSRGGSSVSRSRRSAETARA